MASDSFTGIIFKYVTTCFSICTAVVKGVEEIDGKVISTEGGIAEIGGYKWQML